MKDIERRTACVYHWGAHPRHDHHLHMELEQEHLGQVKAALSNPTVTASLERLLANRPRILKLVHVCEHLTPYYGLNRFLTLLIARHIERVDRISVLEPQTSVTQIQSLGAPHACASKPDKCHGEMHDVAMSPWRVCFDDKPGPAHASAQFNVIVIRHGIGTAESAFRGLTPLAQPRQILPYYLP